MSKQPLEGKVALVGAGAKNVGGLISRDLAKHGANIVVHYHGEGARAAADQTVAAVKEIGRDAFALQGDFSQPDIVKSVFTEAKARFGGIDIAVNTVGKVLRKPIIETTEEEFDSMFDINAKSAYFFIKEAGIHLNDGGKIGWWITGQTIFANGGYTTR